MDYNTDDTMVMTVHLPRRKMRRRALHRHPSFQTMIVLLFHTAHVATLSKAVTAFLMTPVVSSSQLRSRSSQRCYTTQEQKHRRPCRNISTSLTQQHSRFWNRNNHAACDSMSLLYSSSISLSYSEDINLVPCCFQFRRKPGAKGVGDILYTRQIDTTSSTFDDKEQRIPIYIQQSSRSTSHLLSYSSDRIDDYIDSTTSTRSMEISHDEDDYASSPLIKPYITSATSAKTLSTRNMKNKFEYHHYNDALLNRIISGRQSKSLRWRKRTRRAAATLGLVSITSSLPTSTAVPDEEENHRDEEKLDRLYSIINNRPVPPLSSSVSPRNMKLCDDNMSEDEHNKQDNISDANTNKDTLRSGTKRRRFFKRQKPKTPEQYENAKLEWASRYTSLSTLRSTFGTNRNKFWGDFDSKTTRKLYHTLLPRALLGLYEMGLWSPNDLAPLAYEARLAAKKYARERCAVPGRIMSMVYDGFRSWRDWGTWSVEGLSWDQIWIKYEQQILSELGEEEGWGSNLCVVDQTQDELLREEITAQICLRILERSCITNGAIDNMLLNKDEEDQFIDTDQEKKDDGSISLKDNPTRRGRRRQIRRKWKRRNAERDISRIAAQLEKDMEELLESSGNQHLFSLLPPPLKICNKYIAND